MTRRWQDRALCTGEDTEVFFPIDHDYTIPARICAACPVVEQCLTLAMVRELGLGMRSRYGMSGGMTPEERWAADPTAPRRKTPPPSQEAQELRDQLYRAGEVDEVIADRTGLTLEQVRQWRGKRRPNTTDAQKRVLWEKGMSDQKIAAMLGIERTTVQRWRTANGLRSHLFPPPDSCKRGHPRSPENTRIEGVNRRCRVCERDQKAAKRASV